MQVEPFIIAITMPFAVIGALLPDIDVYRSRLKRNLVVRLATIPLTLFGHRTWSHSVAMLMVVALPGLVAEGFWFYAWLLFFTGFASHLLGDWLTHSGIPLFYPIQKRFRSPFPFKTGGMAEYPVSFAPSIAALLIMLA